MNNHEDPWVRLEKNRSQKATNTTSTSHNLQRAPTVDVNLRLLAIGFTVLMYSIVATVLLFVAAMSIPLVLPKSDVSITIATILVILAFIASGLVSAAVIVITISRGTVVSVIMTSIGLLIPCIGLLVIYFAYCDARDTLLAHGAKINFFGVDFSTIR